MGEIDAQIRETLASAQSTIRVIEMILDEMRRNSQGSRPTFWGAKALVKFAAILVEENAVLATLRACRCDTGEGGK